MFQRFTAILPDAQPRWARWTCRSATTAAVLEDTTGSLTPPDKITGRILIGLPARVCRTFALRIPSQDPKTVRKLALVQLEKRGLAAADPEQTPFECHVVPLATGGAVLSVDVTSAEATAPFAALKPAGFLAAARCYSFPAGALVLTEEQGRVVVLAGHSGTLVYGHLLSAPRDQPDQVASEIRVTLLTLLQQGLVEELTALEVWGGFSEAESSTLAAALGLTSNARPHPAPDPTLMSRHSSVRLLPQQGRAANRGRQLRLLKWTAAAALAAGGLFWWTGQSRSLAALEKRAAELEAAVNSSAGAHSEEKALSDRVRATQERWQGLRMALDPRRYPMVHLNGLTRCLGDGGIVLARFESKGPDLAVAGTAQSAAEAYTFYTSVNTDPELRVYEWSMVEPTIAANGTASFNLKGKMR